jgi:maltose O-acetyltransferase
MKLKAAIQILSRVRRAHLRLAEYLERYAKEAMCLPAESVLLYPLCRIENHQNRRSAITIGANSHILGQLRVFAHGGKIQIGESCYVGEDSRIWSAESIRIGNRVQISHGVNIHDNNSHSLSATLRNSHFLQIISSGHPKTLEDVPASPIVVEDDVWIGFNATILKGVTIGQGAVIGAASVVTKDVAAYAIVVGSPARVVGMASL